MIDCSVIHESEVFILSIFNIAYRLGLHSIVYTYTIQIIFGLIKTRQHIEKLLIGSSTVSVLEIMYTKHDAT